MPLRVLFIAEAVTLAHVARVDALAKSLDPATHHVSIAADSRFDALFDRSTVERLSLTSISTSRFDRALRSGRPIYDLSTLEHYVEDDLRVIEESRPDVVVGDFRLSLRVSAALAGKPYVNVTNAGWSAFASTPFTVPDLPFVRWTGVKAAQRIFDFVRPVAFNAHTRPFRQLDRRHGRPPLRGDLRHAYTEADQVVYADLPELFTMRGLPAHHAFIGPVLWSPAIALPPWWTALPTERPIVYVNLGSSGPPESLPIILEALAKLPVTCIVATLGRLPGAAIPPNAFHAPYLPGDLASQRAALVIGNGGSPGCYQAFASGAPVIGVASNLDQYLNAFAVQQYGAGLTQRANTLTVASITSSVNTVLGDVRFAERAVALRDAISRYDRGAALTARLQRAASTSPTSTGTVR